MFSNPALRSNPHHDVLFPMESKETQDIFQHVSLESIREARKKALQSRQLSPRMAGTRSILEPSSGAQNSLSHEERPKVQIDPTLDYEVDQTRLHETVRILKLVGEGHFGKVYKAMSPKEGIHKAAKVIRTKSRPPLPRF